jgi:hypothetical protein
MDDEVGRFVVDSDIRRLFRRIKMISRRDGLNLSEPDMLSFIADLGSIPYEVVEYVCQEKVPDEDLSCRA